MRSYEPFPPPAATTPVRILALLATLLLVMLAFVPLDAAAQTLFSDQADYPPGTTATLIGMGFTPGEQVMLQVVHADGRFDPGSDHIAWSVVADESGGFITTWDVCTVETDCVGETFRATADGVSSGLHAECLFTDATAWSLTIAPTTSGVGQTQAYVLTALNTSSGGGNQMGCITITIPASFTPVGSPSIVPGSTTHAWTVSRVGQVITATANSNGDRVNDGESIKISMTATAPASPAGSPFAWNGIARTNTNCTGASFGIPDGGSPTVAVVCTPPVITCPSNLTVNNDPGACAAIVSFAATATGSPAPNVTYSQAPGTLFPVGTTTVTATATNSCGTANCSFTVTVVDNTPPTITLAGANPMTVECHGTFVDPGASAADNCPGAVPVSVSGAVDVNAVGSYVLTYSATDANSNVATVTRTVNVVDTTKPVVTLAGAASLTVECHGPFADPGATAHDACAGSLAVTVTGSVDMNTLGDYVLTYTATDPSGNSDSQTRTVHVVDTTNPVVALNGGDVTLECHGQNFGDPGASATDGCAGSLAVTVTGTVDVNTVGDYLLTYTATDPSGNVDSETRTVHVVDTTNPVVALNGGDVTLECHGPAFSDPGATANDACAGSLAVNVTGSVDVNTVGDYLLTYTATDPSGNVDSATRTVHVVDTTPPAISAAGPAATIECPTAPSFTAPTATDACDAGAQVIEVGDVTEAGACPGSYVRTRSWKAVDASGNSSAIVSQAITVVDTTPPALGAAGPSLTISCPDTPVFTAPTASDGCDANAVVLEVSDVTTAGSCAGAYVRTKTWQARDCAGNLSAPVSQVITVVDVTPPSAAITGPLSGTVVAVGNPITFTGVVGDGCSLQGAQWQFDTITVPAGAIGAGGVVTTTHTFTQAGVYQVRLTATDACGNSTTASQTGDGFDWTVIVFDPNGGFVTGGGWFVSPAGAYRPNPALTGKANFGFVSKYQKGAKIPTGETEFQFKDGDLNFHSTAYEWLVIAGAKAQYKGTGTVNGVGGYGFLLTGIDGDQLGTKQQDRIRVRIWNAGTGGVLYDNQYGQLEDSDASTPLGGGSIVIQSGGSGGKGNQTTLASMRASTIPAPAGTPVEFALRGAQPNPFAGGTEVGFDLPEPSAVTLAVFDVRGRRVATIAMGQYAPGSHRSAWNGRSDDGAQLTGGVYFVRFLARSVVSDRHLETVRKVVLKR